ncbi:MAG: DUF1684 domain-containing protein [Chloroflexi bacterium]|nr:MAG: DUF1684 domain-containing protein [Chloroflexota bacterium]
MLELLDWRRRVSEMYAHIRAAGDDPAAWQYFRTTRDDLFANHSQTPLAEDQRAVFSGVPYFEYDPAYRVIAPVDDDVPHDIIEGEIGADGHIRLKRIGRVTFTLPTGTGTLQLYWILGYGGGIFLPFGDATNGESTYSAGRYLYDTIKGADLGVTEDGLVLDFNYAYHPSCAYHYRWVCPLAPPENKLDFPIPAGEKLLRLV